MTIPLPFTTTDLHAGSLPEEVSPGRFLWHVPDGWQQGRGAFGGLVLGALVRAIEASEPERPGSVTGNLARHARSVTAEIAGPVLPGDATIEVVQNRRGSGLSAWNATLLQQGEGIVRCSAILARARNTDPPGLHLSPPSPPPWSEVPTMPAEGGLGVPVFTRHLEFRPMGPLPFSGFPEPVSQGWIRTRAPLTLLGAPEIVALADAWWPAGLTSAPAPRPMATVAFTCQLFPPRSPLDPTIPLFYRGRVIAEQDGYMAEFRELWSPDGHLLALNQQTIAWIR